MPERNISRRRNTISSAERSVDTSSSPALLPAKKNLGEVRRLVRGLRARVVAAARAVKMLL